MTPEEVADASLAPSSIVFQISYCFRFAVPGVRNGKLISAGQVLKRRTLLVGFPPISHQHVSDINHINRQWFMFLQTPIKAASDDTGDWPRCIPFAKLIAD